MRWGTSLWMGPSTIASSTDIRGQRKIRSAQIAIRTLPATVASRFIAGTPDIGIVLAVNAQTRNRLVLLVLQPTAFCNLDCGYCYVPERTNPARMSEETLRQVCKAVANSQRLFEGDSIEVLWHAGEPLAAGLPFYRTAQRLFAELLAQRCRIRYTFQTNATLITPAWCEYFKEIGAEIGVSLDGPRDIHDAQRPRRHGRPSFDRVMRGVDLLRAHDIAVNVLSVLTPLSLSQPRRMFDFYCSERMSAVAFNVEEIEGEHLLSLLGDAGFGDVQRTYSAFMRYFLEENIRCGSPLAIRELTVQSQRLLQRARDRSHCADEAENHVGQVMTVSRAGEVSSWSPELASGACGDVAHFSLGNIHAVDSIDELLATPKALRIQAEIDEGIGYCRTNCAYFSVCGGGLPSNKFYENGTFCSTDTLRCRLQVQTLTDMLLDHS